jgi:hypothetical protein
VISALLLLFPSGVSLFCPEGGQSSLILSKEHSHYPNPRTNNEIMLSKAFALFRLENRAPDLCHVLELHTSPFTQSIDHDMAESSSEIEPHMAKIVPTKNTSFRSDFSSYCLWWCAVTWRTRHSSCPNPRRRQVKASAPGKLHNFDLILEDTNASLRNYVEIAIQSGRFP